MKKVCRVCSIEKVVSDFYKHKDCLFGVDGTCKDCRRTAQLNYSKTERAKELRKLLRKTPAFKEAARKYKKLSNSLGKYLKYSRTEKERKRRREYAKKYWQIPKSRKRRAEYNRERCKTDIQFKLGKLLRNRLNNAIKSDFKRGSAVRDLGCSIEELKIHLEIKFKDGMSWESWTRIDLHEKAWNIDHIKPLAKFDLTDREQFLQACHYTNLQPMWAKENLEKHDKIDLGGF